VGFLVNVDQISFLFERYYMKCCEHIAMLLTLVSRMEQLVNT